MGKEVGDADTTFWMGKRACTHRTFLPCQGNIFMMMKTLAEEFPHKESVKITIDYEEIHLYLSDTWRSTL